MVLIKFVRIIFLFIILMILLMINSSVSIIVRTLIGTSLRFFLFLYFMKFAQIFDNIGFIDLYLIVPWLHFFLILLLIILLLVLIFIAIAMLLGVSRRIFLIIIVCIISILKYRCRFRSRCSIYYGLRRTIDVNFRDGARLHEWRSYNVSRCWNLYSSSMRWECGLIIYHSNRWSSYHLWSNINRQPLLAPVRHWLKLILNLGLVLCF